MNTRKTTVLAGIAILIGVGVAVAQTGSWFGQTYENNWVTALNNPNGAPADCDEPLRRAAEGVEAATKDGGGEGVFWCEENCRGDINHGFADIFPGVKLWVLEAFRKPNYTGAPVKAGDPPVTLGNVMIHEGIEIYEFVLREQSEEAFDHDRIAAAGNNCFRYITHPVMVN